MRVVAEPRSAGLTGEPLTPTGWRRRLRRRLVAADVVVVAVGSFLAYIVREQLATTGVAGPFASEVPTALGVLPLWLLIFSWAGCYQPAYLNSGGDAFRRFTAGVAGGVLSLGFVSFLLNLQVSRLYVGLLFVFVFVLGGLVRVTLRRWLDRAHRRGRYVQRVVIAGADANALALADVLQGPGGLGYEVVGLLTDDPAPGVSYPVLGRIGDVLEVVKAVGAGMVVVSPSGVPSDALADVTISLEGTPVDLAVAPSLFQVMTRRVVVESIASTPILHVDQIRLERGKAIVKRTVDLVVATVLGIVLSPIYIVAAAAVRTADGGPALFRQERVGKDGEHFTVLKFRTMVPDAESRLVEVEHLNEVGHGFFKVRDDPRVTAVGRFLRKWSIDELPQLWNVLRGDMSMVGPRPPLPEEVEQYEPWQLRRLRVRPGITGVWQVSGRSHVPFDEAVRMDLFYIENWSLGYDLFLLGKTVLAVLGRRGAY